MKCDSRYSGTASTRFSDEWKPGTGGVRGGDGEGGSVQQNENARTRGNKPVNEKEEKKKRKAN